MMRRLYLKPGEYLIRQGEPSPEHAFMLLRGKCEVFVEHHGVRKHLAYLMPHQIVGEVALIDGAPRTAHVLALEACEVDVMDRETFEACLSQSNPFIVALLRVLSKRYRNMIKRFGQDAAAF